MKILLNFLLSNESGPETNYGNAILTDNKSCATFINKRSNYALIVLTYRKKKGMRQQIITSTLKLLRTIK